MTFHSSVRLMLTLALASPAFATVVVHSPSNAASTGSSVTFNASATTSSCSKGVTAMGIYIDNSLKYQVNAISLNTSLTVAAGKHTAVIQEWDACGGSSSSTLTFTASSSSTGVHVSSPAAGSTVSSPTPFVATATTGCGSGVSAIGIYVGGTLKYKVAGASLNTTLSLGSGSQTATVQEWDKCGGSLKTPVTFTVGTAAGRTKLSNLQGVSGWNQWGEEPPVYDICTSCKGISWSMIQHYKALSLSGNATKFTIGGTTPYADVLWSNKLIGQASTLGQPDTAHKVLPNVHHMIFDGDIYINNLAAVQDLELDVNLYMNSIGVEWGTQCNHLNGNVWDIWNTKGRHWSHTSVPCTLKQGSWNKVSFEVERLTDNSIVYKTITVNGQTWTWNITVSPYSVPSGWYGMTVNYQMDGNKNMTTNTTYLDNLDVTYW
jgi:hypothetical protein